MKRRLFLGLPLVVLPLAGRTQTHHLQFPRDFGAHPKSRVEWWYITGWVNSPMSAPIGFQITFFRLRAEETSANPSRFSPTQFLLAHAALSDPKHGRLMHDQRAARDGFELAGAEEGRTAVWIDDWSLMQEESTYRSKIRARDFELDLSFAAQELVLLQGDSGVSRKGHRPQEVSRYYSRPHLGVSGKVNGRLVTGTAWLDHEWSDAYLAPEAAGWDWAGLNLGSGGALMAFRMRAKSGGVHYAGGTLRAPDGSRRVYAPREIEFEPLRQWRSPRTGTTYPVAMRVRAGSETWTLEPLMDDQELDSRPSTGTIYWEGAVRAMKDKNEVGRGYLELTGYWKPMKL